MIKMGARHFRVVVTFETGSAAGAGPERDAPRAGRSVAQTESGRDEENVFDFDPLYYPYASRRTVAYARKGMVATSQPLAAQAGLDALKRG